jgi:hypothetical protein
VAHRWIWGGGPFQSTASTEAHFGVPAAVAGPLSVRVEWPLAPAAGLDAARSATEVPAVRGQTVVVRPSR